MAASWNLGQLLELLDFVRWIRHEILQTPLLEMGSVKIDCDAKNYAETYGAMPWTGNAILCRAGEIGSTFDQKLDGSRLYLDVR